MSERRRDIDFLADILEAVDRILAYTVDMAEKEFLNQTKTQDAVIMNSIQPGILTIYFPLG